MSLTRVIIIFGVVLVLFAGILFYQFNAKNLQLAFHALPKTDVTIDAQTFHAEIAKAQPDAEKGLSGRASLAQDGAMLFMFDAPGYHPFWMRDMQFPLDMIFIANKKIVAIYSNTPPIKVGANGPLYGSDIQSDEILEINGGLAKKYFFNVGDSVKTNL